MNADNKTNAAGSGAIQKLTRLLAAPTIEPSQRAARIQTVEKDIVLPLRALIIGILGYYFFFSGWLDTPGATSASDWSLHNALLLKGSFIAYAVLNMCLGAILIWARHLALTKIEWMVFIVGALDCVLMGALTFLSSGFDSPLYWAFVALILHNALAIPVAFPQLLLNFLSIGSFVAGGILDKQINPQQIIYDVENAFTKEKPIERVIVLVAWALCCYGIQVLFEKQKHAETEATEFAVRQERLQTAGRLAAEIAHQIKNPLGIITNAAFCLQRAVRDRETAR